MSTEGVGVRCASASVLSTFLVLAVSQGADGVSRTIFEKNERTAGNFGNERRSDASNVSGADVNDERLIDATLAGDKNAFGELARKYQDRVGSIKNVTLQENGLYGDFHFNPKHPLAEQMLWDAEKAPENFGFSHNVEAVVRLENGAQIVDKIVRVRSVDLVADPATTSGLFESQTLTDAISDVYNAPSSDSPRSSSSSQARDAELRRLAEERDDALKRFGIARFLLEKLARADDALRLTLGASSFLEIALESRDLVSAQRLIDEQVAVVREAIKFADERRAQTPPRSVAAEPIVSKSRAELDENAQTENFVAAIRR
jgi:hypothetical protein